MFLKKLKKLIQFYTGKIKLLFNNKMMNKMNKLVHIKNDVYYYLINDSVRKQFYNMFNILGNINSYYYYNIFVSKYNFIDFSFCYSHELFKYPAPKNGQILRIRGKGIPISGDRRGDLLVKLNIKIPSRLSKQAKKDFEELRGEGL